MKPYSLSKQASVVFSPLSMTSINQPYLNLDNFHVCSHKNTLVRKSTSSMFFIMVETLGSNKVLSGQVDVTDKILLNAAHFIKDCGPSTRYMKYGKARGWRFDYSMSYMEDTSLSLVYLKPWEWPVSRFGHTDPYILPEEQ